MKNRKRIKFGILIATIIAIAIIGTIGVKKMNEPTEKEKQIAFCFSLFHLLIMYGEEFLYAFSDLNCFYSIIRLEIDRASIISIGVFGVGEMECSMFIYLKIFFLNLCQFSKHQPFFSTDVCSLI